jgi:glucose/arabinose dehydrogenase
VRRAVVIAGLILTALLAAVPAAHAYTIPPDNPFVSTPGARGEIFVYGLRNPFRWSFDRATGDMFIGDVGGAAREEIDRLPAGAIAGRNLGWSCREGLVAGPNACTAPNALDPIHDYATPGGHAVVGGYVVRDPDLPLWQGRYLFGDALQTPVKWLDLAGPGTSKDAGLSISGLSSFGEDGLGRLYATSLGDGSVYRLRQVDGNTLAGDSIGKFDDPMAVAGPLGDSDQLFVAERGGTLKLRAGGQVHDYLKVITTTESERGFLGVAVAPDYATSGRVFVFYTDVSGDLQLDEFRRSATDPTRADPASRVPILTVPHREANNHNGGQVHFGPDGKLYLSTGDGGGQGDPGNDAQRLDSLLGKVLRIDVNEPAGTGPPPPPTGDAVAPRLTRSAKKKQRVLRNGGIVAYARCNEVCRVTADGVLRIGKRSYPLRGQSKPAGTGVRVRLQVRLTKKARKALKTALRRGRHPVVRVSLRARDAAGNLGSLQRATVRVRR